MARCYSSSPDAALDAIRAFAGPVIVDLDETLYLRNSTEDFIDCARLGLLALLLLRALDFLKPWQMTGGVDTRDTWRVGAISTLFPWTASIWRERVPLLAQNFRLAASADKANRMIRPDLKEDMSDDLVTSASGTVTCAVEKEGL